MNAVDQALYSRLTGTGGLTALLADATSIFRDIVPQPKAYPAVVFSLQAGGDDNKSPRRAKQLLYLVKGVVPDRVGASTYTLKDALSIDAQIDTALHGVVLTVTGWTNYWLMREADISFTEIADGGRRFYHAGGNYRLRIAA